MLRDKIAQNIGLGTDTNKLSEINAKSCDERVDYRGFTRKR
jgi:hypothetical protein